MRRASRTIQTKSLDGRGDFTGIVAKDGLAVGPIFRTYIEAQCIINLILGPRLGRKGVNGASRKISDYECGAIAMPR